MKRFKVILMICPLLVRVTSDKQPPAPPEPPSAPVRPVRPRPVPVPCPAPWIDVDIDVDVIREEVDVIREKARAVAEEAREMARLGVIGDIRGDIALAPHIAFAQKITRGRRDSDD